jgi:hypothetical protein
MSIKSTILKAKQLKLEKANPQGLDFASMYKIAEVVAQDSLDKAKKELTEEIMSALIEIQQQTIKGDKGRDGKNGYTPKKNLDYFDGKDGVDGKDGKNGKDAIVDYAPIIKEVSKIVPKLDTANQIADKLNTKEEIIERKVIKGLEKWMDNIKLSVSQKANKVMGGGGGMGNVEHQSAALTSATTYVDLTNNVACKGYAIWVYYQGQMLARGTGYTISGRRITLLFTPENTTYLDVIYIRT